MVLGLDAAAAADFGNQERWKNLVGVVANTAQDAAQVAFQAANIVLTDSGSPHSSISNNKASTASSKPFDEKKSDFDCRNDTTSITSSTPNTPTRTPEQRRRRDADSSNDSTTGVVEGIARKAVALVTPSPPKKSAVLPPIVVMPTDHLAASAGGGQPAEVRLATMKSFTAAAKAADSMSSSSPEHKLTLKLLRGIDFPTIDEIPQEYSTRLLIQLSVLRRSTTENEGLTDDDDEDIIETIEITDRSQQIWGGPVFTYHLECNDEDEIMLSLIKHDRNTGVSRMIGRTSRQVAFLLNHVRPQLNPNRWVGLSSTDTSIMKSIESLGKIQARLSIKTTAVLHEQENCKTISAGPALAANYPTNLITTYNIRKHALWCTTPVMLMYMMYH